MKAIYYALIALGGLLIWEAIKGLSGPATVSAAPPSSGGTSSVPASGGTSSVPASGGLIPASWLTAIAQHESPSALQGNFQYGAFGLSAGSTPGIGTPGTIAYPSADPNGGSFTPQIYSSWAQATQGLTQWIDNHAPGAWQHAAAGDCQGFVSALEAGGYGDLGNVCSLAA